MHWLRYGPDAILIHFADGIGDEAFARIQQITRLLETPRPPGLRQFVLGFTTVLLEFDAARSENLDETASDFITALQATAAESLPNSAIKEVPVVYNGPDLERVATLNKLSIDEVIQLHTEPIYKVYMIGFAPGFPYLGDLNPRLHTPRLSVPRTRVPAGSVGIGGEHTGIYSVETPGGWNIIGHTTVKLFDPARDEGDMFRLKAGDRVKFHR